MALAEMCWKRRNACKIYNYFYSVASVFQLSYHKDAVYLYYRCGVELLTWLLL